MYALAMNQTNTRFPKTKFALALAACVSVLLALSSYAQDERPDPERIQEMSINLMQRMFATGSAGTGLSASVEFTCNDPERGDVTITANYRVGMTGDDGDGARWASAVDVTTGPATPDRVSECLQTHFETLETGVIIVDTVSDDEGE